MNEKIMELRNKIPKSIYKDMYKEAIKGYNVSDDEGIEYGCHCNYIEEINKYEIYMYVSTRDVCASRINLTLTEKKDEAEKIFLNFVTIIDKKNIEILKTFVK